jgi:hypothetical protein
LVLEAASNDGTVLKPFGRHGFRTVGIELAENIAAEANAPGVETVCEFFDAGTARAVHDRYDPVKLILDRHVLAHVADLHGFVEGLRTLLDDDPRVETSKMGEPFWSNLGIVGLLAVTTTLVGRAFAAAVNIPLLRRATVESQLASAIAGTGLLTLVTGWGSYAGLTARESRWVVLALVGLLTAYLAARGRLVEVVRAPRRAGFGLAVGACLGAGAVVSLLPVYLGKCYCTYSDARVYLAFSEWLQVHPFGAPCTAAPEDPVASVVHFAQATGHRMGPMFLLSLVQAALPRYTAFEVYPAVMAWGFVLNIAALCVLCRWAFRLGRVPTAVGVFTVTASATSLACAAVCQFFCQVYGTAVLGFGLALLVRLSARGNWRLGNAVLLGLSVATLVSVYSELSPFLVAAGGAWLLQNGYRAVRAGRAAGWASFMGVAVLVAAAGGNLELLRAWRWAPQAAAMSGCGFPIPWTELQYWEFTTGANPIGPNYARPFTGWVRWASLGVTSAAVLLGARRLFQDRRLLPLSAALVAFTALFVWFRGHVADPWSHQPGHTWNMFKLAKWVFPLAASAQVAGLALLARRLGRPSLAYAGMTLAATVAAWAHWPAHRQSAEVYIGWTRNVIKSSDNMFADVRRLRRRLDELDPPALYFFNFNEPAYDYGSGILTPAMIYPRTSAPLTGQCRGGAAGGRGCPPGALGLMFSAPPFDPPLERLPLNHSLIACSHPLIVRASFPNGLEDWRGMPSAWIGNEPARLWVFSPRAGLATLSFRSAPGPSRPGNAARTLRAVGPDGATRDVTVDYSDRVHVPLVLPRGLSFVQLSCTDSPTRTLPNDARVLLTAFQLPAIALTQGDITPEGVAPSAPPR